MTHGEMTQALATAERERDEARAELAALTARVESVRAQTIAECVRAVEVIKRKMDAEMTGLDYENDTWARGGVDASDEAIAALRVIATPQPAPVDSLDVDPAAGALR